MHTTAETERTSRSGQLGRSAVRARVRVARSFVHRARAMFRRPAIFAAAPIDLLGAADTNQGVSLFDATLMRLDQLEAEHALLIPGDLRRALGFNDTAAALSLVPASTAPIGRTLWRARLHTLRQDLHDEMAYATTADIPGAAWRYWRLLSDVESLIALLDASEAVETADVRERSRIRTRELHIVRTRCARVRLETLRRASARRGRPSSQHVPGSCRLPQRPNPPRGPNIRSAA